MDVGAHLLAQIGDLVDEGDMAARKVLAAYFVSSAVSSEVTTIGVSIR